MLRCTSLRLAATAALLALTLARALCQTITATADRADALYTAGQTVTWTVEVTGAAAPVTEARYVLKRDGYVVVREGAVPLQGGKGRVEATLDRPGTLLLELSVKGGAKDVTALAGAAFSRERIGPSQDRPADFDEFWKAKLAELARVAPQPRLERLDSGDPGLDYYKLEMDNIRGSRIHGQLARPREGRKLPALLIVQWAGVYGLQRDWVAGRAKAGWLVLDIMPHDLPFDRPQTFYDTANTTTHANYPAIGNDDRETAYFLRMYLSCYRAAQYLTTRSDWDGRTLVVTGGSQGGLQSIVTAALHPKVTAVVADVPAGCDLNGPVAGRAPGWPMWHWQTGGKDSAKVREAARYYDVVNFASRVRCPVLIGLGLVDVTCPAPGVFAAANQLKGPAEVVVMPNAGHGGEHRAYWERSEKWLSALVRGDQPPVASSTQAAR